MTDLSELHLAARREHVALVIAVQNEALDGAVEKRQRADDFHLQQSREHCEPLLLSALCTSAKQ